MYVFVLCVGVVYLLVALCQRELKLLCMFIVRVFLFEFGLCALCACMCCVR